MITGLFAISGCSDSTTSAVTDHSLTPAPESAELITSDAAVESFTTAADPATTGDTADTVENQPTTDTGSVRSEIAWNDWRYLSDDDVFAVVVKARQLSESPILKPMYAMIGPESTDDAASAAHMEWITISGNANMFISADSMSGATICVQMDQPITVEDVVAARFPEVTTELISSEAGDYYKLSGLTQESTVTLTDEDGEDVLVSRTHGVSPMVLHFPDTQTVVFCSEKRLNALLVAAQQEAPLRTLLNEAQANSDAPVQISVNTSIDETFSRFLTESTSGQGVWMSTAGQAIQKVVLNIDPGSDPVIAVDMTAKTNDLSASLFARTKELHQFGADYFRNTAQVMPEDSRPVFEALSTIMDQTEITQEDETTHIVIDGHEQLPNLIHYAQQIFSQNVTAR